MNGYKVLNCRIHFRSIEATLHDAYLVTKWRNQDDARAVFFSTDVVTPDTHLSFMAHRKLHDLVWIVEAGDIEIGMAALIVDVRKRIGETGRAYVDHGWRGKGYHDDIDFTRMCFAFDVLNLNSLWCEVFISNEAVIASRKRAGWEDYDIYQSERGPVSRMIYTKGCWKEKVDYLTERVKGRLLKQEGGRV